MKPAFLVDGLTEKRFVQRACKGRPVQILNCNGETVAPGAIAKRAASLIRLWGGRCFPIVILVDRESRQEGASEFAETLSRAIRDEGIEDEVIVGVADRMIENWMIADPALWPDFEEIDSVDGISGVSVIKRRLGSYNKAANGPELLHRCRASEIRTRSTSFSAFADQLSRLRCSWLRR